MVATSRESGARATVSARNPQIPQVVINAPIREDGREAQTTRPVEIVTALTVVPMTRSPAGPPCRADRTTSIVPTTTATSAPAFQLSRMSPLRGVRRR